MKSRFNVFFVLGNRDCLFGGFIVFFFGFEIGYYFGEGRVCVIGIV